MCRCGSAWTTASWRRRPVDIAPQAAAEVRLGGAAAAARQLPSVPSTTQPGIKADNARYLVLDPPGAVPVYVITSEPPGSSNAGLYVERALAVADDGRAFNPQVIDGRDFSALPGERPLAGAGAVDRPRARPRSTAAAAN